MSESVSPWLGLAGIVGGGFFAFRYLNRAPRLPAGTPTGNATPSTTTEALPGEVPVGTEEGEKGEVVPTTNTQWGRLVTDRLVGMGWNGQVVSTVVGKYLQRLSLSNTDADVIRTALGQYGQPPENGPWPLTIATPAPVTEPPPKPIPITPTPPPPKPAPAPAPKPAPAPAPKPVPKKLYWVQRTERGGQKTDAIAKKYTPNPKTSANVYKTFKLMVTRNKWMGPLWKKTMVHTNKLWVPTWR